MTSTAYRAEDYDNPQNVSYFPLEREKNDQKNNNYDHDDHDNNNYYARARERRVIYDEQMAKLRETYFDVFGRDIPRFVEREIEDMTTLQIQLPMITAVIEYTACAPRPSWNYARAVIYRTRAQGIISEKGFRDALKNRGRATRPYEENDDLPY